MNIDITDLQDKVKLNKKKIVGCARFVLNMMDEEGVELSLLFVTDSHIRRLNSQYRKIDSATDVLAFSMREGSILGDVVISTETARREALSRKVSPDKEIYLYLIHGILHLLGYDDQKPKDRKKMKAKEEEMLSMWEVS